MRNFINDQIAEKRIDEDLCMNNNVTTQQNIN